MLGRHPADDADVIDPVQALGFRHGGKIRPQDGLAPDPDLVGDGGAGGDVVAGDHPDPDVRRLGLGHCGLGLGPGRVDHPDQRGHLELLNVGQEIALGIEPDQVEVTLGGGHDPLTGPGHALDIGLRPVGEFGVPRDRRPGRERSRGPLHHGRRGALDETAHDGATIHLDLVEGGHQLVGGVERQRGQAWQRPAGGLDVDPGLGPEHE